MFLKSFYTPLLSIFQKRNDRHLVKKLKGLWAKSEEDVTLTTLMNNEKTKFLNKNLFGPKQYRMQHSILHLDNASNKITFLRPYVCEISYLDILIADIVMDVMVCGRSPVGCVAESSKSAPVLSGQGQNNSNTVLILSVPLAASEQCLIQGHHLFWLGAPC